MGRTLLEVLLVLVLVLVLLVLVLLVLVLPSGWPFQHLGGERALPRGGPDRCEAGGPGREGGRSPVDEANTPCLDKGRLFG